jgi:hypothetical protein
LGFSDPLPGSDDAAENGPGLTVVGGTEHRPPVEETGDSFVTLSEAADDLGARAAHAHDSEAGDVDHGGEVDAAQEGYSSIESAQPESQA